MITLNTRISSAKNKGNVQCGVRVENIGKSATVHIIFFYMLF